MFGYSRHEAANHRMSFHARVGQPALNRIGLPVQRETHPKELTADATAVPRAARGFGFPIPGPQDPSPESVVGHDYETHPKELTADATAVPRPARGFGFPIPGPQDPSPESVVGHDYFVTENQFESILDDGDYDYIVIGSSFMALAFCQAAWAKNANVRILILERGRMWLPSHFQNLPLPFRLVLGGRAETFPWTLSERTFTRPEVPGLSMALLRGSCPFFGGKSTVWSAWSPNPHPDRFRNFPETMIETMKQPHFWPNVNAMLNVTSANDIGSDSFKRLQPEIDKILEAGIEDIEGAMASEPAKLAVGPNTATSSIRFSKYSVPGPLLSLVEKFRDQVTTSGSDAPRRGTLQIVTDCVVQRLGTPQKRHVRSIETSRGTLSFMSDRTKIVLCAGVVPSTTLVLNSIPHLKGIAGKRLTGHSMSHFTARVAKEALNQSGDRLQIAANYLSGEDKETGLQYHIQITAIYCPRPEEQIEDLARECPDFAAAPTLEQLSTSTDHVVFVCATLGELAENGDSRVTLQGHDPAADPTTNVTVHIEYTERDKKLWDFFDRATFDALSVMSNKHQLEYWHEGAMGKPGFWTRERPPQNELRIPGVVHEASTLFMGREEDGGSVNENYLLHGTENVYVTGAALFPTCGSWNPTPVMCGFAQDLADKIVPRSGEQYCQ